jgi:hypothetical protein
MGTWHKKARVLALRVYARSPPWTMRMQGRVPPSPAVACRSALHAYVPSSARRRACPRRCTCIPVMCQYVMQRCESLSARGVCTCAIESIRRTDSTEPIRAANDGRRQDPKHRGQEAAALHRLRTRDQRTNRCAHRAHVQRSQRSIMHYLHTACEEHAQMVQMLELVEHSLESCSAAHFTMTNGRGTAKQRSSTRVNR